MPRSRPLVAVFATALIAPVLAATATSQAAVPSSAATVSTADVSTVVALRVRQRAKLLMHPQIADAGTGDRSATKAKSAMTGQFKPRAKGRPVALQRKVGRRWDTVSKQRMAGSGRVEFTAPYSRRGKVQTYRVVALRHDGLRPKASKAVSAGKWGSSDFRDDFSGSTLGAAWQDRVQGYGATPDRTCSETGTAGTRAVGGGTLRLFVKKGSGPEGSVLEPTPSRCAFDGRTHAWRKNGHVSTDAGRFQFQYGYAAARMKFHRLAGQHASFWLQPGPAQTTDPGTEIDVIEWFGDRADDDTELSTFVHRNGTKVGGLLSDPQRYGNDWFDKFHVFSVEWTPKQYIFRIDGQQVFTTKQFVSHRPEFLILSNLSSDYELKFLPEAKEDQLGKASTTTQVDWVRVWKR